VTALDRTDRPEPTGTEFDSISEETQAWLDRRYHWFSPDGVYVAHQPIYGFRAGYCEPWLAERYVRTVAMVRALARLQWKSLLDVGGAEGYKAHLAQSMLGGSRVVSSDLSRLACQRAHELYGLETAVADVQALPFADGEFDVVTCSETLEHVPDFEQATRELLRVARCAVVITVPHEPAAQLGRSASSHDHLHALTTESLGFLRDEGFEVLVERLVFPLVPLLGGLIEGGRRSDQSEARSATRFANRLHDRLAATVSRVTGERAEAAVVAADSLLCRLGRLHRAIMFVAIKDPAASLSRPRRRVTARDVIGSRIPVRRPGDAA
jgi:ubiquinone/menaquinone biosynthesis C-methylase UbiE